MRATNTLLLFLFVILICWIFSFIFRPVIISGGDYIHFWPQNMYFWEKFPFSIWDNQLDLGSSSLAVGWGSPYRFLMGFFGSAVAFPIPLIERIFYWIPFLLFCSIGPYFLIRYIFPHIKFPAISSLLFLFNSYILMIIGGGQIAGIGLAYAFSPISFILFLRLVEEKKHYTRNVILAGFSFSILLMFDIRIFYILFLGCIFYFLLYSLFLKQFETVKFAKNFITDLIFPSIIIFCFHSFWIIPLLFNHQNPLQQFGSAYTTEEAVKFFSFAKFENTFGLMHPNWPENVFGKVGFMRPEFFCLPILAYCSLLFIKIQQRTKDYNKDAFHVLYFAFLGLLGAFLAKGASDPFGQIYLWMFSHVPGFILFRDSTKWYLLIALSYSMLIPYTIEKIYLALKKKFDE